MRAESVPALTQLGVNTVALVLVFRASLWVFLPGPGRAGDVRRDWPGPAGTG